MNILKALDLSKNPSSLKDRSDNMRLLFGVDGKSVRVDGQELSLNSCSVCLIGPNAEVLPETVLDSGFFLEFDRAMWQCFLCCFPHLRKVRAFDEVQYLELEEGVANVVHSRIEVLMTEVDSGVGDDYLKLLFWLFLLEILLPKYRDIGSGHPIEEKRLELDGLLEANFRKQRSTRFYARRMGVSPRRLNSLCREWFDGKAFFAVLMDRLFSEADMRLLNSDDLIKVIALELGFKSPQNFRMYFVRYRGISPMEFRKNQS